MTTRYKDLAGEFYETAWNLKPTIYRDDRHVHNKSIEDAARPSEDLVKNVEKLSRGLKRPGANRRSTEPPPATLGAKSRERADRRWRRRLILPSY